MNIALILSGGEGLRLGRDIPKQYIEVSGKPVIAYCLKVFEAHKEIDAIQIVAEESWKETILKWTGNKCRGFSVPGETRQLSVLNGLSDILNYSDESDTVIIHDAARPFVTKEMITSCLEGCIMHDGCVPVLPIKDTVYIGDGKKITSLIDRSLLWAGQAPEAFLLGKYYEATKRLLPKEIMKIHGSTEPAFMAGMDVALVPGDENNFKITTAEDLRKFQEMVSDYETDC